MLSGECQGEKSLLGQSSEGKRIINVGKAREGDSMVRNAFEQALARAVVEPAFRVRLLTDPVDTLVEYGLAADDAIGFEGLNVPSLPEFSALALRRLWDGHASRDMTWLMRLWGADHRAYAEGPG